VLHGSSGGGMFREGAAGTPVCATVTLLDGLVFARSVFDSSMNYRSAVVMGTATALDGEDKLAALEVISEHVMPGRWSEVRETTRRELAATTVLRLPLDEVSVKVRAAGPSSAPGDGEDRSVWAGVVPLTLRPGAPVPAADVPPHVPVPASVLRVAST